jgi:hypothetical protein
MEPRCAFTELHSDARLPRIAVPDDRRLLFCGGTMQLHGRTRSDRVAGVYIRASRRVPSRLTAKHASDTSIPSKRRCITSFRAVLLTYE